MIKLMKWLDIAALSVAALSIVVMMLIVSWDAVSRYLLHAPLVWSFEIITYYLLGISLYMAVSATFKDGDHVNIDLFRLMFPARLRNWIDVVWCLMAAFVFGLIAYAAWKAMGQSMDRNQFFPGIIRWPAWVSYVPIIVGSSLTVLRLALHSFELAVWGKDEDVVTFGEPTE